MSSIFGNSTNKPGGLFGASTTASTGSQPQQTGGLFGNLSQPSNTTTGGLFSSSTTAQPQQQTGGLFGSTTAQKPMGGLFGSTTTQQAPQTSGLFGSSTATQQPQNPTLAQSFLAGSQAAPLPRLGQSQWTPAPNPREKPIRDQMHEIFLKWHPASLTTVFHHYFYQHVGADRAPYFGVPEGEDPRKWEEALAAKPSDGDIPVLAKGFGDAGLAGRIRMQDAAVKALYERVHEIDASLKTRIEEHDLKFTVRAAECRRRHVALSRRCLALATKVQVLRNRGYALDGAEEDLKRRLEGLEKEAFDPVVNGRQEELWARMTVVRERAKMLKDETERLGKTFTDAEKAGGEIDEETMGKIRSILTGYDSQLAHLRKEIDMIKKDFEDWDSSTKTAGGGSGR